ncbi:MAG TPA: EAL domain-containing protein [Methylotenera sp.]|jgi:diguanylate cyclase (GGDEF)-like protein/PAS domain S-box-containing protein
MQTNISTIKRFLLPLLVLMVAAPFVLTSQQTSHQLANTHVVAKEQAQALIRLLNVTDELISNQADNAMHTLKTHTSALGAPAVAGVVSMAGGVVPNLLLGSIPVTNNHELVDRVSAISGGTATIFVKAGNNFVRATTNVKRHSGARATGTILDPNGKAAVALRQRKPFSGVVEILDEPYLTRYEPMLNKAGVVVGAYYVGFKVDMKVVRESVQAIRQLDTGFAAILDADNEIRFLSSHISRDKAETLLKSQPESWVFIQEQIPNWGFKLIIAYSVNEARAAGLSKSWAFILLGTTLGALLIGIILWQLRRLIFMPLGADPALAIDVVKRIAAGNLEADNIVAKPNTLMANVLEMRKKLRESMEKLRNNAERMRLSASVFDHAHDGIFITDAEMRILEVNIAFTQITGYSREAALGSTPQQLGFAINEPDFFDKRMQLSHDGDASEWRGETWNRRAENEVYPVWLDVFIVRNDAQQLINYVGLFSDITEAKQHQQNLERMAYHDSLTQLPNRTLLSDRLDQAFSRAERTGELLAVCCLDLDGFKPVNDSLGHEAGDHLLIQLAERMNRFLRESDTVARIGGDEFALLLNGLHNKDECRITLERLLSAIRAPYVVAGQSVTVSSSIGYTIYPFDKSESDTLLRHADQAMYQAKLNGGSCVQQFDAEHDREFRDLRQGKERIEAALAKNEFCLYFQPKVDMQIGKVVGMEALIRWQHPDIGLRAPATFMPIIENTDFSITLGEWAIRQAIGQLQIWQAEGLDLQVSVNIAARHMVQENFTERLAQILSEFPQINPTNLELEITETAAIEDVSGVVRTMHGCKLLGVSFALDDFGVGYSSLTYLRRLPVAVIKVDRSFVHDMLQDSNDLAMVAGIISLGRDFRCKVVAEGVETAEHGLQLLRLGCTVAQGFGIAKPMPADQVSAWVKSYHPNESWAQLSKS